MGEGSGGWHPVRRCARQVKGGGRGTIFHGVTSAALPSILPAASSSILPSPQGTPEGTPRARVLRFPARWSAWTRWPIFEGPERRTSLGGRIWCRPQFRCAGPRGPGGPFLRGTRARLRPRGRVLRPPQVEFPALGPRGPARGSLQKSASGPRGPEHENSTCGRHHTRPPSEVRRTGPSKKGRLVRADQRTEIRPAGGTVRGPRAKSDARAPQKWAAWSARTSEQEIREIALLGCPPGCPAERAGLRTRPLAGLKAGLRS